MKSFAALVFALALVTGCVQPPRTAALERARSEIVAMEYDGVWYSVKGGTLVVNCAKETLCP
jgi:hypothetical protein